MKGVDSWQAGRHISQAIRPRNLRLPFIIFTVTALLSDLTWPLIAGGLTVITLCYGIVVIINDLVDYEIDQANQRDLPLVTGAFSPSQLKVLLIVLGVLLIGILWFLPPILSSAAALYCLIGWAYSCPPIMLSHRGMLAPLILGIYYAVIPFQIAWRQANGDIRIGIGVSFALLFLSIAYLLYKDFKDLYGDKKHGKKTPLVLYGAKNVKRLSLVSAAIGFGVCYSLSPKPLLSFLLAAIGLGLLALQYRRPLPSPSLLQGFFLTSFGSLMPIIAV